MNGLHRQTHESPVPGCYGCKLLQVQIGSVERHPVDRVESRWDADMASYRRMRRNGLQPRTLDGCAQLEQVVESQFDIDYGRIEKKDRAMTMEAIQATNEQRLEELLK